MSNDKHPSDHIREIIKNDLDLLHLEAESAAKKLLELSTRAKARRDTLMAFVSNTPILAFFTPGEDRREVTTWDELLWVIRDPGFSQPQIQHSSSLGNQLDFYESFSNFISAMGVGATRAKDLGGSLQGFQRRQALAYDERLAARPAGKQD
jgi:hypothetical protein